MKNDSNNSSNKNRKLSGLVAAPFTPLRADNTLNLALIPKYASWLADNGVSAIFICGTTGEGFSLTTDERRQLAEAWMAGTVGKLKVVVHVAHNSLDESRQLAAHAEQIGAHAIASIGPTFFRPANIEQLVDFCEPVAAAAPGLPFYYYHMPAMTGVNLPMIEFLRQASKRIPNLAGIKFTDENLMSYTQCLNFEDGRFNLLFGRDEILLAALALGATGAVGSTYNYMAPIYHQVMAAFAAGDMTEARLWQMLSIQIIAVMARHGGLPAGKAMMSLHGLDCGPVRPPLKNLSADELKSFRKDLKQVGFPNQIPALPAIRQSPQIRRGREKKMNHAAKTLAIALTMSASLAWAEGPFEFSQLPALPDREGFAGAFAGVADGCLIVAGGANFPDKKPWENGKKVWYDTVFALKTPDAQWQIIGKLPCPLGYGVSVTTSDGIVCIGGSDADKHHAETFLLTLKNGQLHTTNLSSLPIPVANGAGALVGETIYVFGGSDQPGDKSALNRLFALDLKAANPPWRELEPCPGKARILPVAAALDGDFYIAGGAALELTNGKIGRVYLRDAGKYRPGRGWQRIADLPKPAVAAPTPAPVADSKIFILGGDDGSLAGFQPPEKHPGFPKSAIIYDARSNQWSMTNGLPVSRAVLPTTFWQGRWVLPNGETRPGVRSPEVWAFTPTK